MYSSEYKQVKEPGAVRGLLKALLLAMGLTLLIFLVSSLLLAYTGIPESAVPFITVITVVISVGTAGAVYARAIGRRGYLSGAAAGILYVLVLYLLSLLMAGGFHFSLYIPILAAIGLFGGAFGGIIGINLSGKRKR